MTRTPSMGPREHRGEVVTRLNDLAARIKAVTSPAGEGGTTASPLPAPVLLAHAGRGFAVGGVVSKLLDQYGLPRRDNFATCAHYCAQAMTVLRDMLGPTIMRRYSDGVSDAELLELSQVVTAELLESTPEDVDVIAGGMITLGAVLYDITKPVADNPDLAAAIRRAATIAADAAAILHSHYGGDGGGW